MIGPAIVVLAATPAAAATVFPLVFSANTNGDILIAANTLETCSTAVGATNRTSCAAAQSASAFAALTSNNDFTAAYVDVDADSSTFNSSRATVTIPAGGTVLYALLSWGGRTSASYVPNADPAAVGTAAFTVPGAASSQPVAATHVDTSSDSSGVAYQATLDVTGLVAAAGSGTYTMANVQSSVGGVNQYAGWSLVVAVSDPAAPARNLSIFTGFGSVGNGGAPNVATLDLSVSGFLTPPSGPVRTTLGAVTYEGDMGKNGDTFKLNSTTINDALNSTNNPFNSTISNRGIQSSGRTPSYNNQLGFDADLLTADGVLGHNATSATLTLTTVPSTGEQYFPGVVTFATDLYDPKLLGTKTVANLDRAIAATVPGDTLRYTVPIENIGLDTSTDSIFFDAIPTGTTYVPGSMTVDGTTVTDAHGDDTGEFAVDGGNGHLLVNLGIGATASAGGDIPVTSGIAQHTVVFDAIVNADVTAGQELVNAATLSYKGLTTAASSSSATNAVISPVVAAAPVPGNVKPIAAPYILTFTPTSATPSLTIPVLNDATDPEGDALRVVAVTDASGGTVAINLDGTITYTPRDDSAGRDVFTYTIEDSAGNRATATIQVEVVNTSPTAGDDTVTVPANRASTLAVLPNDSDPNGDALTVRSADAASTQGGTVSVVNGVVTYTPAAGFRGTDTFHYVVQDSRGATDTAIVTVTVANNPPVAGDDDYATPLNVAVPVAVLGNDSDADTDVITAAVLTLPAHGSITLGADGTGTYTPAPGFTGVDMFTYTISDGHGGTDTATVSITVNGPPTADDDADSTPTNTPVTVDVLGNDSDPDGDALSVTGATDPAQGAVVVNTDGTVTYTPDAGYAGVDTFDYTITDGGLTDTATVRITVSNAPPVAGDDTASTPVSTPVEADVLVNDSDPNIPGTTQTLTVTGATADAGATVTRNPDYTLTVTPATGYKGPIIVTYTVSDGAGGTDTGQLVVTVANGLPSAVADAASTPTDTPVTIDVRDNDSDPNGDPLTIVPASLTGPVDADGTTQGTAVIDSGQVRYTPPAGFAGTVTFDYTITDGTATASATVTVVVANAPPAAHDDAATTATGAPVTVDVLDDDTDPNVGATTQTLTVTSAVADHGATVVRNVDGTLTVTPAPGYRGPVTVTYTVSDGAGGTDTGELVVTVRNAPPVAGDDTATTPYTTPVDITVRHNDSDPNGDPLTIVAGSVTAPVTSAGVTRGTVTVANGIATYTPPAGFSGVVTFDYTITDGTGTDTATVTVTVGNAPPAAAPDSAATKPGAAISIDVTRNDDDPDGGTLAITGFTQPTTGTVTLADGHLVYTPAAGFSGTVTFTYTANDGQGGTTTGTVTVLVSADAGSGSGSTGGTLARTGAEIGLTTALAVLLLVSGLALVVAARRRRA